MRFGHEVCASIETASRKEWLETNGLGGFASSTIAGLNTRRYHGLLTAAVKPPVGRHLLLSKMEETLVVDGRRYELSANRYPGVVHPQGHLFMHEFRLEPFPVFVYRAGGFEVEKRVFMVHGENTTVLEYEVRGPEGAQCLLEFRPLLAFRDYHSVTHRNNDLNAAYGGAPGLLVFEPYEFGRKLFLAHNADQIETTGHWYFNFEYDIERERGLEFQEDLFNPVVLRFRAGERSQVSFIASTERRNPEDAASLREREVERRAAAATCAPMREPLVEALAKAAGQFIVERGELKTIIAGYHWFCDWGRDTMIALPGLTLVTGQHDIARDILLVFAEHVDCGMLPNRFPDAGEAPEYNTVDASLWFFEAIRSYLHYSGDVRFVRERLYPVLRDIVGWHVRGTRFGICVDDDGLLACGQPGVQLTWMDAKVGDWVVTPRHGKPVEVQALWYNALRILEDFAARFDGEEAAAPYREMADQCAAAFLGRFWNEAANCLYDVVDGDLHDGSIRPNQVIALSLTHTMVPSDHGARILDTVRRELLTPMGLRSLSPFDPRYKGVYEGNTWQRDGAYHQGTVWAWLMGPFLTAWMRVHQRSPDARRQAEEWLREYGRHLSEAGLGQISEIFDGDSPHRPRGCIAQAWSVGELLRAAVEDVYEIRPAARGASACEGPDSPL